MINDTATVLWKELTELTQSMRRPAALIGIAIYLGFFGVGPALMIGPAFASSPLTLAFWIILPAIVGIGVATNAFAGERERHTLETLLATRLPDRAILFGKLGAAVLFSMSYVILAMLVGLVTLNLASGEPGLLLYSPTLLLGGFVSCLLVSGVLAAAGVLTSLRAATVREAAQKLSLVMLLLFVPYFSLNFIPLEQRAVIIERINQINLGRLLLIAGSMLSILAGVLMKLTLQRFQRAQLLPAQASTGKPTAPSQTDQPDQPTQPAHTARRREMPNLPTPLADLLTVIWKEWHEMMQRDGGMRSTGRRSGLVGIVLIGIILPLQSGQDWVTAGGALFAWIIIPAILVMQTIADSFAGERERHTLETLLATRLSARVILIGKLITPLLWAWAVTQGLILISLVTVNLAAGQGTLLLFPPEMLPAGMGFGLLLGLLMASIGVLLSLRAATVRQAQQALALAYFALAIGYGLLIGLTIVLLELFNVGTGWLETGGLVAVGLVSAGVLAVIDAGMLALALRRFRRDRLLLV